MAEEGSDVENRTNLPNKRVDFCQLDTYVNAPPGRTSAFRPGDDEDVMSARHSALCKGTYDRLSPSDA